MGAVMKVRVAQFYRDLFALAKIGADDARAFTSAMARIVDFDFDLAAEVWEFLLSETATDNYTFLGENIFKLFCAASEQKAARLVIDSEAVREVLFVRTPAVADGLAGGLIMRRLWGGRFDEADEIFGTMLKNPKYGAGLLRIVERMFEASAQKNGGRASLKKKLREYILSVSAKIKTCERAVIGQRIKEIS